MVNSFEVIILVCFSSFLPVSHGNGKTFQRKLEVVFVCTSSFNLYIYIYIYKTAFKRLTAAQTHKAPFYVPKTFSGKNITCIIQSKKGSQKGGGQIKSSSVVVFGTKTL